MDTNEEMDVIEDLKTRPLPEKLYVQHDSDGESEWFLATADQAEAVELDLSHPGLTAGRLVGVYRLCQVVRLTLNKTVKTERIA